MAFEEEEFIFGKDLSPSWFSDLIEKGKVEWINEHGIVKGCYFTNKTGADVAKMIGDKISKDEI